MNTFVPLMQTSPSHNLLELRQSSSGSLGLDHEGSRKPFVNVGLYSKMMEGPWKAFRYGVTGSDLNVEDSFGFCAKNRLECRHKE